MRSMCGAEAINLSPGRCRWCSGVSPGLVKLKSLAKNTRLILSRPLLDVSLEIKSVPFRWPFRRAYRKFGLVVGKLVGTAEGGSCCLNFRFWHINGFEGVLRKSNSALDGLTDYSQVGMLRVRCKFVNFGTEKSPTYAFSTSLLAHDRLGKCT